MSSHPFRICSEYNLWDSFPYINMYAHRLNHHKRELLEGKDGPKLTCQPGPGGEHNQISQPTDLLYHSLSRRPRSRRRRLPSLRLFPLGSVRQLADADGQVNLAQSYRPFGEALSSSGEGATSYGFAGEY